MRIQEIITETAPEAVVGQIASLIIFLRNRAEQKNSKLEISTNALINMAQGMDIPLSKESFKSMAEQNTAIKNLIKDFNDKTITLKSHGEEDELEPEIDPAELELPEEDPENPEGEEDFDLGGSSDFSRPPGGGFGGAPQPAPPAAGGQENDPFGAGGVSSKDTINQMSKRALSKRR